MGSAILQLFTVEEILIRLADKQLTGCFHLFTLRESANIFLKDGEVVAATKAEREGEEVLQQVLAWNNPRYLWEPDAVASPAPTNPLKLNLAEFLARQKTSTVATGKLSTTTDLSALAPATSAQSKSTAMLASPAEGKLTSAPVVSLTATKTFPPSAEVRAAQEQALITKHKFLLVSGENPDLRFMITRISSLVGRNPACDIPIPHPSISRQHCLFQITERGLHAKDLDTTNGTKVNGIALKEGYVNVGDKLMIGHLPFTLKQL